jgi:hypothetical protein
MKNVFMLRLYFCSVYVFCKAMNMINTQTQQHFAKMEVWAVDSPGSLGAYHVLGQIPYLCFGREDYILSDTIASGHAILKKCFKNNT